MDNRELMKSLKWEYNKQTNLPVFSEDEIEKESLRWLKNLLLVRVGLRTLEEIKKNIYRCTNLYDAKNKCYSFFISGSIQEVDVIIKLVPYNQNTQLPNYHIRKIEDVEDIFNKIVMNRAWKQTKELWICWFNKGLDNVCGRLSVTNTGNICQDILEIMWCTPPRNIETIKYIKNDYAFLLATRYLGHVSYSVNHIGYPQDTPGLEKRLTDDFKFVVLSLFFQREKIELLQKILCGIGIREVCIEFVISSGKLKVIDWDI